MLATILALYWVHVTRVAVIEATYELKANAQT